MNFDASNPDAESVQCAVCEKEIMGGKWFARIAHGSWVVALCCPLCTEVFESNPKPYIARIETLHLLHAPKGLFTEGPTGFPGS